LLPFHSRICQGREIIRIVTETGDRREGLYGCSPLKALFRIFFFLDGYCDGGRYDATGIQWVEVRDSAKYPIMHNTLPTTKKNYGAG
jgi:hypothetical protein